PSADGGAGEDGARRKRRASGGLGAARDGQCSVGEGSDARDVGVGVGRAGRARRSVWAANAPQESRFHGYGDAHTDARHRREYSYFQRGERVAAQTAALPESRSTRLGRGGRSEPEKRHYSRPAFSSVERAEPVARTDRSLQLR